MTAKYDLTKYYNKGMQLSVTLESVIDYLIGDRITLTHSVEYKNKLEFVDAKPKQNYNPKRYRIVDNYGNPIVECNAGYKS